MWILRWIIILFHLCTLIYAWAAASGDIIVELKNGSGDIIVELKNCIWWYYCWAKNMDLVMSMVEPKIWIWWCWAKNMDGIIDKLWFCTLASFQAPWSMPKFRIHTFYSCLVLLWHWHGIILTILMMESQKQQDVYYDWSASNIHSRKPCSISNFCLCSLTSYTKAF